VRLWPAWAERRAQEVSEAAPLPFAERLVWRMAGFLTVYVPLAAAVLLVVGIALAIAALL
jgi:hypothetical protein